MTGSDEFGVIELASTLVSIPSITGHEGDLAAFLARWLTAAGLRVTRRDAAPGRPNVRAVWTPPGSGADEPIELLFHAHMDTVAAFGQPDAFRPRTADGALWGRGAVDQKGGLAAAAAALGMAARGGKVPRRPVGLAAVIDEESEHRGSMALVADGLKARRGIVTEPSGLRVVIGCKGTMPFRVRVHGRAAHAARPWLGENAVEHAMALAQRILKLPCALVELPAAYAARPRLEKSRIGGTFNLGLIQGGVAYNIVPDQCELWFDRRTVPGETQEGILQQVRALIAATPDLRAEVDIARPDWHWDRIQQRGLKPTLVPADSGLAAYEISNHAASGAESRHNLTYWRYGDYAGIGPGALRPVQRFLRRRPAGLPARHRDGRRHRPA